MPDVLDARRRHTLVLGRNAEAAPEPEAAPGGAQVHAAHPGATAAAQQLGELALLVRPAKIRMERRASSRSSSPQRRYFTVAGYGPATSTATQTFWNFP